MTRAVVALMAPPDAWARPSCAPGCADQSLQVVAAIASSGSKSAGRDVGEIAGVPALGVRVRRQNAAGSCGGAGGHRFLATRTQPRARSTSAGGDAYPSSSAPRAMERNSKRASPRRPRHSPCSWRLTPRSASPWRRSWCASRRRRCPRGSTSRSSRRTTSTRWMRRQARRSHWRRAPPGAGVSTRARTSSPAGRGRAPAPRRRNRHRVDPGGRHRGQPHGLVCGRGGASDGHPRGHRPGDLCPRRHPGGDLAGIAKARCVIR